MTGALIDVTSQYRLRGVTEGTDGPVAWLDQIGGARVVQGCALPGRHLEQVCEIAPGLRIAFLTHGILPEERLSLVLLQEGQMVERADLALAFAGTPPGIMAEAAEGGLRFRFPAERVWHLRLTAASHWRLPRLIGPLRYHPQWRGRLKLTQEKVK